jgi:hypothetical protein
MKGAYMERYYDDIKSMLCKELEEIGRKGELTTSNLDVMYRSVDILKDLETIKSMQEAGYSNTYSGDYSERYMRPMYAYDGQSYDNRGRGTYAERDSMGRYSSDYSRDDSMTALQGMMNRAKDEHEREVLRKAMDSMRNR